MAELGYTYTDDGQLATATSYDGSGNVVNQTSDTYDAFGHLASEAQAVTGAVTGSTPSVGYTTDPTTGRMSSMTYPDGRTLTYNYGTGLDGDVSRLTRISDAGGTIQSYGYQGTDTPLTMTNGNGVTLTVTLDALGRTASRTYTDASGTVIDGQQYTYDANSNVLSRRNLVLPGQSELYTYDGLNRLVTFARGILNSAGTATTGAPTGTESWNLDAVGNWDGNTVNGTTTGRTNSAQNQVNTVGSATLAYDANGNTLTDNTGQQYVYDAWNRLVAVKNASGAPVATYTYDAQGRRVTEYHTATNITTSLYYSNDWQVLEEAQGGTATAQYVWSPFDVDGLVERDDRNPSAIGPGAVNLTRRLYAEQDADDDVTSLTDTTGAIVERYAYDPYGAVTVENPDGTIGRRSGTLSYYGWAVLFQGKRLDPATGTYDYNRRVYLVSLGRFGQQDPTGGAYVNGADLYQFELSGPVIGRDPTGTVDIGLPGGANFNPNYGPGDPPPGPYVPPPAPTPPPPAPPSSGISAGQVAITGASLIPVYGNYIAATNDFYHGHWGWGIVDIGAILLDESGAGEVEAAGRTVKNLAEDAAKATEDAEHAKNAAQGAGEVCEKTCFVAGTLVFAQEDGRSAQPSRVPRPPVVTEASTPWLWSHRWEVAGGGIIVLGSLGYFAMAEADRRRRRLASGQVMPSPWEALDAWVRRERRRRRLLAGRAFGLPAGPFHLLLLEPR